MRDGAGHLCEVFRAAVPSAHQAAVSAELEHALADACSAGRAAWSKGFHLEDEVFVRCIAVRVGTEPDPVEALQGLHVADLWLACACACGDPSALAAFDRQYLRPVQAAIAVRDGGSADEVAQLLRERLLVGAPDHAQPPRIARYEGRGPLAGWLRVAAARVLIDLKRAQAARRVAADTAAPAPSDPELEILRRSYGEVVHAAIEASLSALAPREAAVLRLAYLEGMTTEEIGAAYGSSRRTVKRWLAAARDKVLEETRRRVAERIPASDTQIASVIRLVQHDLDVSIARLLCGRSPV